MLTDEIKEYIYKNGDHQKVDVVHFDSFNELEFLFPKYSLLSFEKLYELYDSYIMEKYGFIFGQIVLFTLPDHFSIPDYRDEIYGEVSDPLCIVNIILRKGCYLVGKKICFKDDKTKFLFHQLEEAGCLKVAHGHLNTLSFLPVGKHFGFLSENEKDAKLKVNANFFVMDLLDCGSVYDSVSTPIGLCVKDGQILNPPLFDREVLLVNDKDEIAISRVSLNDLQIEIDHKKFIPGKNCLIYTRPDFSSTPGYGFDVIISGNEVVACKEGGRSSVPSGGFVIKVKDRIQLDNRVVEYHGLENINFAIQAGNSVMNNGIKTTKFISKFYNFMQPWKVSYPPSMYPLNYKKSRAPRIVLGTDDNDKPILLWLEGAGKFGFQEKKDSVGASLSETAEICEKLGVQNAIHLDGGGSAQILIHNQRRLKMSDRNSADFLENERAVPVGLIIR